jgi:hypothetical protein
VLSGAAAAVWAWATEVKEPIANAIKEGARMFFMWNSKKMKKGQTFKAGSVPT